MNHDVYFSRYENVVRVHVQTDLAGNGNATATLYTFPYTCNSIQEAELLYRYLRDRHKKAMQEIRQAEFDSGWRHGRAKKKGRAFFDWFLGGMSQRATHGHIG
jgi:hypothetical protein